MSRNGVILDTSQPPQLAALVAEHVAAWPEYRDSGYPYPRALWLSTLERWLEPWFPQASSRDRNDTARSLAPFPLAEPPTAP